MKILIKIFLILVTLFLPCSVQAEISPDAILNAFMEFKGRGYSNDQIKEQLKRIIDNNESIDVDGWHTFIQKFEAFNKDSMVPRNELYKLELAIIEGEKMVANLLMEMAYDYYSQIIANQGQERDGSYYFIIPQDIHNGQKYLQYAVDVLSRPYKSLDDHPHKEDLDKIIVNSLRAVDLYKEYFVRLIQYLEEYNKSEKKARKKILDEVEKTGMTFQIESQKSAVYIGEKSATLAKEYHFKDEYFTEEIEKTLIQLEKAYEEKY